MDTWVRFQLAMRVQAEHLFVQMFSPTDIRDPTIIDEVGGVVSSNSVLRKRLVDMKGKAMEPARECADDKINTCRSYVDDLGI